MKLFCDGGICKLPLLHGNSAVKHSVNTHYFFIFIYLFISYSWENLLGLSSLFSLLQKTCRAVADL